jgi:NitT/TauT family transport system permease protein
VLRVVAGLGLAVLIGIPAGVLIGRCHAARDVLQPSLAAALVVSPIAWLPIAILVFGLSSPASVLYGQESWRHGLLDQLQFAVIAVIFLSALVPIAVNTAAGASAVRRAHLEALSVLGGGGRDRLFKVILPSALPAMMTGLRLGGGIAWRVIVAAEIFPGTRSGLGYMIRVSHEQAAYEYVFAAVVIIAAIGIGLDSLLSLLASRAGHWQQVER